MNFMDMIKKKHKKKKKKKKRDKKKKNNNYKKYGDDKKTPLKIIKIEKDKEHILYMLKNSQYKRCNVIFENNQLKCMIVMKDGNGKDYKYKRELSKRNKIYKPIEEQALKDYEEV